MNKSINSLVSQYETVHKTPFNLLDFLCLPLKYIKTTTLMLVIFILIVVPIILTLLFICITILTVERFYKDNIDVVTYTINRTVDFFNSLLNLYGTISKSSSFSSLVSAYNDTVYILLGVRKWLEKLICDISYTLLNDPNNTSQTCDIFTIITIYIKTTLDFMVSIVNVFADFIKDIAENETFKNLICVNPSNCVIGYFEALGEFLKVTVSTIIYFNYYFTETMRNLLFILLDGNGYDNTYYDGGQLYDQKLEEMRNLKDFAEYFFIEENTGGAPNYEKVFHSTIGTCLNNVVFVGDLLMCNVLSPLECIFKDLDFSISNSVQIPFRNTTVGAIFTRTLDLLFLVCTPDFCLPRICFLGKCLPEICFTEACVSVPGRPSVPDYLETTLTIPFKIPSLTNVECPCKKYNNDVNYGTPCLIRRKNSINFKDDNNANDKNAFCFEKSIFKISGFTTIFDGQRGEYG